MKKKLVLNFTLSLCCVFECVFALQVCSSDACKIGEKIWKNECGGTIEGLTNWNKGESFPSLGIGHFIWYPKDHKNRFHETFPDLLKFLEKKGVLLPTWLKITPECPWTSREDFYKDIQSVRMQELRQFLLLTKSLQAIFITDQLEEILPQMLRNCTEQEKDHVRTTFFDLSQDAIGLYALIDYLNFKGAGISPNETYNGQGWGLLQVIKNMPASSKTIQSDFIKAAKETLAKRVENSPPERNEKQWLRGWFNRLDTYASF